MIKLVHFSGFVHRTLHGGVTEQSATTDDERRDLYESKASSFHTILRLSE